MRWTAALGVAVALALTLAIVVWPDAGPSSAENDPSVVAGREHVAGLSASTTADVAATTTTAPSRHADTHQRDADHRAAPVDRAVVLPRRDVAGPDHRAVDHDLAGHRVAERCGTDRHVRADGDDRRDPGDGRPAASRCAASWAHPAPAVAPTSRPASARAIPMTRTPPAIRPARCPAIPSSAIWPRLRAGCDQIVVHAFSEGARRAKEWYCAGETLDGRIVGYVLDDPNYFPDVGQPCTPGAGVRVVLYGTRLAPTDSRWTVDYFLLHTGFGNCMDKTSARLGTPIVVSPRYFHEPYTHPSPPQIANDAAHGGWFR